MRVPSVTSVARPGVLGEPLPVQQLLALPRRDEAEALLDEARRANVAELGAPSRVDEERPQEIGEAVGSCGRRRRGRRSPARGRCRRCRGSRGRAKPSSPSTIKGFANAMARSADPPMPRRMSPAAYAGRGSASSPVSVTVFAPVAALTCAATRVEVRAGRAVADDDQLGSGLAREQPDGPHRALEPLELQLDREAGDDDDRRSVAEVVASAEPASVDPGVVRRRCRPVVR